MSEIDEALDEIENKGKNQNKQTRKSLDPFFLVGDQPNVESHSDQETPHSELLNSHEDIWSWFFLVYQIAILECNELDTNYFFDCFAVFHGMVFFLTRIN